MAVTFGSVETRWRDLRMMFDKTLQRYRDSGATTSETDDMSNRMHAVDSMIRSEAEYGGDPFADDRIQAAIRGAMEPHYTSRFMQQQPLSHSMAQLNAQAQNMAMQAANNSAMNAQQSAVFGTGMANGAGQAKSALAEEGVLMWQGRVLPENWRGAHYSKFNRASIGPQWRISMTSEWSSDTIMLWLSMDKYSGEDADTVARTYIETINQRRVG
jgi:hypothetical protein